MTEQQEQKNRVSQAIAKYVAAFLDRKLNQEFHNGELYQEIVSKVGYVAPDSPGRIMRDLKAKGLVNYEVKDRAKSLYVSLPKPGELF